MPKKPTNPPPVDDRIPFTKGTLIKALEMMECSDDTPVMLYDCEFQEVTLYRVSEDTYHEGKKPVKIVLLGCD